MPKHKPRAPNKPKTSLIDDEAPTTNPNTPQPPDNNLKGAMQALARRAAQPLQVTDHFPPPQVEVLPDAPNPPPHHCPHRGKPQTQVYIGIGEGRGSDDTTYNDLYNIEDRNRDLLAHLLAAGVQDHNDLNDLASLADESKPFTERQLTLLAFYFEGAKGHIAAKKAGYKAKSKESLATIASQVLGKLEASADHRQIWRRMGLGEARLGAMLLDFLHPSQPKSMRLEALKLATKAMGLLKDVVDAGRGATIIIGAAEDEASPHEYHQQGKAQAQAKPMRITK